MAFCSVGSQVIEVFGAKGAEFGIGQVVDFGTAFSGLVEELTAATLTAAICEVQSCGSQGTPDGGSEVVLILLSSAGNPGGIGAQASPGSQEYAASKWRVSGNHQACHSMRAQTRAPITNAGPAIRNQ